MKNIAALALLLFVSATAQEHKNACDVFLKINYMLQTRHVEPKPVDDSLSVYVFNTVIEELDDNHILFLQEDYDRLLKHKYKIDDYLTSGDCSFFTDFITTYKMALVRNRQIASELFETELPLNTTDTIYFSKRAFPYNKDIAVSRKFIRKKITYDILEDIAKLSKNKDSLIALLPELSQESKNKIRKTYLCRADAQLNPKEGFEENVYNRFYTAFCAYFDPHSTYFNYDEKASFVSSLVTENYSIGIYVSQNDNEEIIVEDVVPGGPAYKTSKIDKGDQILKLAANDKEYSVSCSAMETITDIVFSDSYRNIELTLRKKDGTIYSVNLEKMIMKSDNHSVYSYILGDAVPVGYIKIPSFYSAFDSSGMKGCAEDVAKEIAKLKKQGIKGIIIDLQHNGGGSMDEVINLAGMFINFGPVTIIKDKDNYTNTIQDYNRGMLYDGPVVVLVNGLSASASEFFAGVMQDYNRALIVGSPTMGKASMQTILPLSEDNNNQDFIKISIDKFYRITGKSSQYTGILPDVELPMLFDSLIPREKSLPTAMKNDTLAESERFKKMPAEALRRAADLSSQRVAASGDFNAIKAINGEIDVIYQKDKKPLPVNFNTVFDDVHATDRLWAKIALVADKENDIPIKATAIKSSKNNDEFYISMDEYKRKSIKTDLYIAEGYAIIKDICNSMPHQK
ncbi:S41 family peptidase [Flavobacterium sp.]|uniref:S41 family peptidase n=1 Tax=Flavobacterium sp. TaxID=239 RepID=UPI00260B3C5D|nr:S41 family peptidase [Flavobacterium sp.]